MALNQGSQAGRSTWIGTTTGNSTSASPTPLPSRRQLPDHRVATGNLYGGRSAASRLAADFSDRHHVRHPAMQFRWARLQRCAPPDTVGDVGLSDYVQATNDDSGTNITIYNKADGSVAVSQFNLSTLATGATGGSPYTGHGDPIVLYDHLADRWL